MSHFFKSDNSEQYPGNVWWASEPINRGEHGTSVNPVASRFRSGRHASAI